MGSSIRADLAPVTDLADGLAGALITTALTDIADKVEEDVLEVGRTATGGDLRLSHYKGKGRMSVKTKVSRNRTTLDLEPPGLWALAIGGAKPHYIGPGTRTRGGKSRRKHPGFRGKNGLDKVWAGLDDLAVETIEEAIDEAVN